MKGFGQGLFGKGKTNRGRSGETSDGGFQVPSPEGILNRAARKRSPKAIDRSVSNQETVSRMPAFQRSGTAGDEVAQLPSSWDLGGNYGGSVDVFSDPRDTNSVTIRNLTERSQISLVADCVIPSSHLKVLSHNRQAGDSAFTMNQELAVTDTTTRSISHGRDHDIATIAPGPIARAKTTGGVFHPSIGDKQQEAYENRLSKHSLYYFEVAIKSLPSDGVAAVGLLDEKHGSSSIPGESRGSVGLDSNGVLKCGGKPISSEMWHPDGKRGLSIPGFSAGDVVGCAVEMTGLRRILFMKNGKIIVPATRLQELEGTLKRNQSFPAVGLLMGRPNHSACFAANFGLEKTKPFAWKGSYLLAAAPSWEGGSNVVTAQAQSRPNQSPQRTVSLSPASKPKPRLTRLDGALQMPLTAGIAEDGAETSEMMDTSEAKKYPRAASTTLADAMAAEDNDRHSDDPNQKYSASTGNLDSDWATSDGSSRRGRSAGSSQQASLEFSAIDENSEMLLHASTLASPPDPFGEVGGPRGDEEEKTAIDDEQAYSSSDALSPKEIDNMKENVRMLRSVCADTTDIDVTVLESLLDCCKADQRTVQLALNKAMTNEDESVDLMELININDIVVDAVNVGEETIKNTKSRIGHAHQQQAPPVRHTQQHLQDQQLQEEPLERQQSQLRQSSNLDLDIKGLIRKKDVFSLICILRAQSEQRLDAALALMEFAKDGERPPEGGPSLRDEIRSAGGMHSLLQVFRAKGTYYELRVVSGMAVAYVLPSFMEASTSVGLKIMECLRFLSTSRAVKPNGVLISRKMMYDASAMGVTAFWMYVLEPMLASGALVREHTGERSDSLDSAAVLAYGGIIEKDQQALELQELLEMTVSLIVHIEKTADSMENDKSLSNAEIAMWRYTNIEQVCSVDVARPIAVREGLLPILVGWIKSNDKDKLRPAVSALRYLTSIKDKYMAGWIHSQIVNEAALGDVIKLADDYNAGRDTRLALAQILASLCVAPHTRAAVVEANCMHYLIGFLFDHSDEASQEVALFAGRALTQLAAGAITRASVFGGGDAEILDSVSPDKRDTLIDDIVDSGAVGSFIAIALGNDGQLRAMAIEAIRVLSEDRSTNRRTRLQFCEEGAAKALGRALQDDITKLREACKAVSTDEEEKDAGAAQKLPAVLEAVFMEVLDALCGLANILEPVEDPQLVGPSDLQRETTGFAQREQILSRGCMETCESGGLVSLLRASTIPLRMREIFDSSTDLALRGKILLRESCRTLTSLSPLLLSSESAEKGYARWAGSVLEAFHEVLDAALDVGTEELGTRQELSIVLCGLEALSTSEPLKIRIVDKTLAPILQLKNLQGDQNDVANIAGQVFLSLGFAEDEIAVQVAGSNPNYLAEWFCLRRSLTLQAMVRAELRKILLGTWKSPHECMVRQRPRPPLISIPLDEDLSPAGQVARAFSDVDVFDNFADDDESMEERDLMVQQYKDVCDNGDLTDDAGLDEFKSNQHERAHLLKDQVYPFNDSQAEIDWILSHHRSCYSTPSAEPSSISTTMSLPAHVETFIDTCFPSKLLRNHILPVFNLRPDASFNFRAIMMPQRKYFSFRREGQMVSRLCDTEPETLAFEDVHWTLGFTNSTFAGEFSESLVQALYLCSTIRSLSFARDPGVPTNRPTEGDGEETVALAKLVGYLPPWIDFLTFKNIFDDKELRSLIENLDKMGQLSADQDTSPSDETTSRGKGQFWSVSITHCQRVRSAAWQLFFSLLGRSPKISNPATTTPLSSLVILDLSFNGLGDGVCAMLLDIVHDAASGCRLAQLDLSGNRIGKGVKIVNSLRNYVEQHRYIPILNRRAWGSSLHTLNLSSNGLGAGTAEMEILAMLKYNALGLKCLDLSDNDLCHGTDDYQFCQVITSSLSRNNALRHLNLSKNKYSARVVEDLLDRLADRKDEISLTFLGIDDNTPPISPSQRRLLESFVTASRTYELQRVEEISLIDEDEFDGAWIQELKVDEEDDESTPKSNLSPKTACISEPQFGHDSSHELSSDAGPRGDNMITVLFSAPLVFHDDRRQLRPFKKLDFDMERELMWQCMKEASRDIELSFDTATHDRLLAAMTKRCSCLHYSGHGHQMALPFEDGQGGPNWFKVDDIRTLIARGEGAAPFKFVFVSACHSGLAGETFASAGVPHVVCCQQQFELKDTAALAFTRQFYLSLAIGHTVKESFEQGCKAVRATPNLRDANAEMKKFVLLPKDGNHDIPIFNAVSIPDWPKLKGSEARRSLRKSRVAPHKRSMYGAGNAGTKQSELGVRNMMQEDPSPTPPQFFLGREVEMYYILKAVLGKRLVSVVGETGVGRSSVACAVCHYINERASTIIGIERIYFVRAKKGKRGDSCRSLIEQLLRKLSEAGKGCPPDRSAEMEDMFEYICRELKNEKALLVFDRMEYLESSDDAQEFPMFLSSLFRGTKNAKVLLTNRQQLGIPSVGGQVEYPFPMGPLNFENTVRLFANLCPHLHTEGERYKLYQHVVKDYLQADLRPLDQGLNERTKSIFSILGDGVPSRIEKAAYDITAERLQSLINDYRDGA